MLLALRMGGLHRGWLKTCLGLSVAYLFCSLRLAFTQVGLQGWVRVEGRGEGRGHRGDETVSMGALVHICTVQPARCLLVAGEREEYK